MSTPTHHELTLDRNDPESSGSKRQLEIHKIRTPFCEFRVALKAMLYIVLSAGVWTLIGLTSQAWAQLILQRGDQGPEVAAIQRELLNQGYLSGSVDGEFGPLTEDAIFLFQRDSGLVPDGTYGPETEAVLFGSTRPSTVPSGSVSPPPPTFISTFDTPADVGPFMDAAPGSRDLRQGDSGSDVEALQRALTSQGFSPGAVDGIFGPATESAVRSFQSARGLTIDGIVGPATWRALGFDISDVSPPTTPGAGLTVFGLPQQGPFVVAVPASHDDTTKLQQARRVVSGARFARSSRGLFIFAGGYRTREEAEDISLRLQSVGLDSRVAYFRDDVTFR
jgi:peptidoglycan hydrolase-like protein with peptidoglycan-binding domain